MMTSKIDIKESDVMEKMHYVADLVDGILDECLSAREMDPERQMSPTWANWEKWVKWASCSGSY